MGRVPYISTDRIDADGNALPKHKAPAGVDRYLPKEYRNAERQRAAKAKSTAEQIEEIRQLGLAVGDPWDFYEDDDDG